MAGGASLWHAAARATSSSLSVAVTQHSIPPPRLPFHSCAPTAAALPSPPLVHPPRTQDVMSVVLFSVIPQLVDVLAACTYMAARLQPWTAIIVACTGAGPARGGGCG